MAAPRPGGSVRGVKKLKAAFSLGGVRKKGPARVGECPDGGEAAAAALPKCRCGIPGTLLPESWVSEEVGKPT